MTTAHRDTWKAARGGLQEEGSFRLHAPSAAVSAKDAPTEPELKRRFQPEEDVSRETLRARVEGKEDPKLLEENPTKPSKRPRRSRFSLHDGSAHDPEKKENSADDGEVSKIENEKLDKDGLHVQKDKNTPDVEDEGEKDKEKDDNDDGDSEDDDDDESEDEAELLAELEKIREERELERIKKQEEEREEKEREEMAKVASGNPLLKNLNPFQDEISETASLATGSMPAFAVRRRWDDDVIFKNQARGERKVSQRFVNDTIRNDYHRSFMKRFMG